jgi:hypothetical protein
MDVSTTFTRAVGGGLAVGAAECGSISPELTYKGHASSSRSPRASLCLSGVCVINSKYHMKKYQAMTFPYFLSRHPGLHRSRSRAVLSKTVTHTGAWHRPTCTSWRSCQSGLCTTPTTSWPTMLRTMRNQEGRSVFLMSQQHGSLANRTQLYVTKRLLQSVRARCHTRSKDRQQH